MRFLALYTLLLVSSVAFAEEPQANPAEYPLVAHVTFSRSIVGRVSTYQHLDAVLQGQEVELDGGGRGLLALGDYPARVSTKGTAAPKEHPAFDLYQSYELLMPDGTTRVYQLTGMGAKHTTP